MLVSTSALLLVCSVASPTPDASVWCFTRGPDYPFYGILTREKPDLLLFGRIDVWAFDIAQLKCAFLCSRPWLSSRPNIAWQLDPFLGGIRLGVRGLRGWKCVFWEYDMVDRDEVRNREQIVLLRGWLACWGNRICSVWCGGSCDDWISLVFRAESCPLRCCFVFFYHS